MISKVQYGDKIVADDNLVFYVDAYSILSGSFYNNYNPFTGSIWYDLSNNEGDITMTSIPVSRSNFVTDGGGAFEWASGSGTAFGAWGVGQSDAPDVKTKGSGATIEYFVQVPRAVTSATCVFGYGFSSVASPNCSYWVGVRSAGGVTDSTWVAIAGITNDTITSFNSSSPRPTGSAWTCVTVTISSSLSNPNIYYNGTFLGAGNNAISASTRSGNNIQLGRVGNARPLFNGVKVGHIKVWDKILTADEILQSYNTTKGRYGL